MISFDDFKYHPCDPDDDSWTETLFMIFSVPEAGVSTSTDSNMHASTGV